MFFNSFFIQHAKEEYWRWVGVGVIWIESQLWMMFFFCWVVKNFFDLGFFGIWLLGQSWNCFSVESLFCFHLVYIVIIKKKSSATETNSHQKYNYCKKVSRVTIINYEHKMICCQVLFASLRTQERWVNHHTAISWTITKGFMRTVTDNAELHFPLSKFSLIRGCHFLALSIWRKHNAGSLL